MDSSGGTALNVPFKEKDRAKTLGARWNSEIKRWVVPAGRDLAPFRQWIAPSQDRPGGSTPPVDGKPDDPPAAVPMRRETKDSGALLVRDTDEDIFSDLMPCSPDPEPETDSAPSQERPILPLSEYLSRLRAVIDSEFSTETWVKAEAVSIRRHTSGHVYLELSEGSGRDQSRIKAMILSKNVPAIFRTFEAVTGGPPAEGMSLAMSVTTSFHPTYGLSLLVSDIDPRYTIGEMEMKLVEIRKRLKEEGSLDRQRETCAMPFYFDHVVVVSPGMAAGLGDFRRESDLLEKHGLCRFTYFSSVFQGKETKTLLAKTIEEAVDFAVRENASAVVIIRGGGAKSDLAWINEYEIASAVAFSPVPVLSGIGHERDSTIVDEVSLRRFDTPSKVAHFVLDTNVQRISEAERMSLDIFRLVGMSATQAENGAKNALSTVLFSAEKAVSRVDAEIASWIDAFRSRVSDRLDGLSRDMAADLSFLSEFSPKRILGMGFALAKSLSGQAITSCATARSAGSFSLSFSDGTVNVRADESGASTSSLPDHLPKKRGRKKKSEGEPEQESPSGEGNRGDVSAISCHDSQTKGDAGEALSLPGVSSGFSANRE